MTGLHRTKEWAALTRKMRPLIDDALPLPCVNGKGKCWVLPGQRYDVGHIIDAHLRPDLALDPSNVGPACPKHNRSAGGTAGAAKTNAQRRRRTGKDFIRL